MPLGPRQQGSAVLSDTQIDREGAKALADAADGCWQAIMAGTFRPSALRSALVRGADRHVPVHDEREAVPE